MGPKNPAVEVPPGPAPLQVLKQGKKTSWMIFFSVMDLYAEGQNVAEQPAAKAIEQSDHLVLNLARCKGYSFKSGREGKTDCWIAGIHGHNSSTASYLFLRVCNFRSAFCEVTGALRFYLPAKIG